MPNLSPLLVRQLGIQDYQTVWQQMQTFTDSRDVDTQDEIWLVQHASVFTQGQAVKAEHLLLQTTIPAVQSDRGGQMPNHGLGQKVVLVLMEIKRKNDLGNELNVRQLVITLEQSVLNTLADIGLPG
ncbi:lipoyl(octanoyl) transferase LipB, partial [Streptococcus suis]